MNNKKWWIGGGLLAIVVVVAVAVWFFLLKDDAPDAVSNDAANADLDAVLDGSGDTTLPEDSSSPEDSAPTDDGSGFDGTIDGTWVVDDEIGEFDFETASGSFAGFRVAEELQVVGDTTAVGRSGDVSGTVTIADGSLTGADITVDMTTIVSDRSLRESAIRRAIEADEFPTATFVFTDSIDVSAVAVGGDAVSFSVPGELTVHGTTREVTFEIEANVRDDGFAIITGNTEIVWEDFGVTPPSAPTVVSVADEGTVEFQLVAQQG